MNKQQFLDIEQPNARQWTIQQLTTQMSKTQLIATQRNLHMIAKAAYKTSSHEMTFSEMCECVLTALNLHTNDSDQLEN